MADATPTPFGLALALQREAARMGQRTVEQGIDAQRAMTEAFVRNSIGMGRVANRNTTEATRQGMVAVAGMMDAMVPGASARSSVGGGFESVANAQETAWRLLEESAEDAMAAYADMAESQKAVVEESVTSTLEVHGRMGTHAADAAVEYERQKPERIATREPGEEAGRQAPAETIPVEEGEPTRADEPAPAESADVADAETGEVDVAETADTGPESAADEVVPEVGLEDISGIGSAYAARLRSASVDSPVQLRDADVAELSEATEISDERLENWQKQVRHLLEREEE
jgi:predicted flap endonuclease-1-like 5' DNA nuclease